MPGVQNEKRCQTACVRHVAARDFATTAATERSLRSAAGSPHGSQTGGNWRQRMRRVREEYQLLKSHLHSVHCIKFFWTRLDFLGYFADSSLPSNSP
jgi:hypothetical protein